MNKSFHNALSAVIATSDIASKDGLSYLSAASAMGLAGRPVVNFVDFDGQPQLFCLNGALVAVDLTLPDTETVQRIWLPVMDQDNKPISRDKIAVTDVNNSRQRCLVKAIAAVYGDGMSLYLACDGNGAEAAKILGVEPDTDLATVTPVVATLKEGGVPYVEWGFAIAACRITDPSFHWKVVEWNGLPFREVLGGMMVDVETTYRGKTQCLSLAVMDSAFNPIPADKVSVFDWNKSVMRALTKCIAFNTGYGLGVYANEFGNAQDKVKVDGGEKFKEGSEAKGKKATSAKDTPAKTTAASAAGEVKESEAKGTGKAEASSTLAVAPESTPEAVSEQPATTAAEKTAEPPQATDNANAEFITRFKGVLQKRRSADGTPGVIKLFGDLAVSTKYTQEEKPVCYGVLMPAVAAIATGGDIASLLAEIKTYNAMQYVAKDSFDMVAGKLTATALAAALAVSDEALLKAVPLLVEAGVGANAGDVMRLAKVGGVPSETLDLLVAAADATAQ